MVFLSVGVRDSAVFKGAGILHVSRNWMQLHIIFSLKRASLDKK